jgi:hypothetical protein
MHQPSICCGLLLLALLTSAVPHAQSNSPEIQNHPAEIQTSAAYRLSVAVDEVDLTFHASDAHGLPVNDLKLEEVKLLDNLQPPGRILRFELLKDFPIRAGILMDMSESMDKVRSADRAIAIQYAQHVLRRQTDQAFVVNFDRRPAVAQGSTGRVAPAGQLSSMRSIVRASISSAILNMRPAATLSCSSPTAMTTQAQWT